jgi:hypothetical protein
MIMEEAVNPPAVGVRRKTSAPRMNLLRARRKRKLRCLTIEIREGEIDAMVRRQHLRSGDRTSARAIRDALYLFFDRPLR